MGNEAGFTLLLTGHEEKAVGVKVDLGSTLLRGEDEASASASDCDGRRRASGLTRLLE